MTTKKILMIDDDTDDQLFFDETLHDIDLHIMCEVAGNGLEGLQKLRNGFIPDVILLDLNMPYMNGFDFLRVFREEPQWDSIPVVIVTTSNQQRDIDSSKALGAQAFLTKPNNIQELQKSLEQLLIHDFTKFSQQMVIF